MDFSSIHNIHEKAVYEAVARGAAGFPALAGQPDLLADVACVALNHLPARYVRHDADLAFYRPAGERAEAESAIGAAVEQAFGFVQARHLMRARR